MDEISAIGHHATTTHQIGVVVARKHTAMVRQNTLRRHITDLTEFVIKINTV